MKIPNVAFLLLLAAVTHAKYLDKLWFEDIGMCDLLYRAGLLCLPRDHIFVFHSLLKLFKKGNGKKNLIRLI